ncbi:DUF350 domain-containing protein [Virgibacillus sp. 7505]|uniref:DUF350 domain-containing protein n=1 Tax=Bacillaceae TaxID=186817 RepID=UPI000BA62D17|nr:DUF350 domain-containing protein [Virgibacillus sp. 7505]PAE16134.1 DUF350 domain-containing protein [Virgibacillus sp. 7505]
MELFLSFLSYLGAAIVLLAIGTALFEISTKAKEFKLITQGNQTAALVLGGKVVGLALVLGSSIAHSISMMDMVIWGAVGIVSQIVLYYIAELATVRFSINKAVEDDNKAIGILLFLLSLSLGWIIAQCLTY